MPVDRWHLYRLMLRSRLVEQAIMRWWDAGLIYGEMHLGIGEEGIVAGVMAHVREGDALSLDYRNTPAAVMRGVDLTAYLRECLGHPQGLCRGQGGHMHVFSRQHLLASTGIIGAAGVTGAGFALALQLLHPGAAAVAFFGEGALNQGMLLETLNLAALWRLPLVLVCKDNGWSITSRAEEMNLTPAAVRVRSFGLPVLAVDGAEVTAVHQAAAEAFARARHGEGATFLHATCRHLEGHFLGDTFLRTARHPLREMPRRVSAILRALIKPRGGALGNRLQTAVRLIRLLRQAEAQAQGTEFDPLVITRGHLMDDPARLQALEAEVAAEVAAAVQAAQPVAGEGVS